MGRKTHIVVSVEAAIGRRHFRGALQGRGARVLAEVLVVAEDRLDDHDRVVDQHADRQHETHQRHDVEGQIGPARLPRQVHEDKGDDHRDRDGDRHQQGGAKAPQEEEHEEHRQRAAEEARVAQLGEAVAHVVGVVAVDVDLEALAPREAADGVDLLLGAVDHRQQVGGRGLVELDVQRLLAVEEVPLLLFGVGHLDLGDVTQPETAAEGEGADLIEGGELALDTDEVAPRALANRCRQKPLGGSSGSPTTLADVDAQRCHAVGNQVDLHLPGFVAADLDIGHPLEALQAADDDILGEAVEAFARPVGADVEAQDRPVWSSGTAGCGPSRDRPGAGCEPDRPGRGHRLRPGPCRCRRQTGC